MSKLRSRKGASLIVALFLLILCSTVGSIILTAATANVGRISERSEYDRKYYAVISAARLFADTVADMVDDPDTDANEGIALTLEQSEEDGTVTIKSPPNIEGADDTLLAILQNAVYDIYTGHSEDVPTALIAQYWEYDFRNIGKENSDYRDSEPTDFTIDVKQENPETDEDETVSTVYGRFAVEVRRMKGDINPALDSVTHNITAIFYSDTDEEAENEIPEDAYIVKLTCPADTVYPTLEDENTMRITFKWQRDNMKIEQARGVA